LGVTDLNTDFIFGRFIPSNFSLYLLRNASQSMLFLHNVAGHQPQAIRQNAHGSGLFQSQLQHPTTIKSQPIEFVRLTTGQQWDATLIFNSTLLDHATAFKSNSAWITR
jgi:hypothetical protein